MLRHVILFFVLLAAVLGQVPTAQVFVPYQMVCSYATGADGGPLYPPAGWAVNEVRQVTAVLALAPIPVYAGSVDNAQAVAIPMLMPGRAGFAPIVRMTPAIVYNPDFMAWVDAQGPWAAISVMAHEVGHHANQDSSWYGQFKHPWTKELQADFVSGYVLARLGAPLEEAAKAQLAMFTLTSTPTHPDTPKRLDAIEQGWLRGGGVPAFRQMYYQIR